MAVLGCDAFQADRHLRALAAAGYLVHDSDLPLERPAKRSAFEPTSGFEQLIERTRSPGSEWATQKGAANWYHTSLAWRLGVDKLLKRMTRREAEKLYDSFISEVRRINASPDTLVCITSVALFGSMLDPTQDSYGDIDLHVETRERPMEDDLRTDLRNRLAQDARRIEGYMMTYESDESAALIRSRQLVKMRLQKLGRRISLSQQSPEDIGTVAIQIYAFDPHTGKDICRTLAEASEVAKGLLPGKIETPPPRTEGALRAKTVGIPQIVSGGQYSSSRFDDAISTKALVERTAQLMEIRAYADEPCPTCASFWCAHIAPSTPPPVIEGSGDHYLIALESAMRERPLGSPLQEVKHALRILGSDPSSDWYRRLSPASRYLTITKAGLSLNRDLARSGHVNKYDYFAISNGRIDLNTSPSSHPDAAHFVALMRLREALIQLWKSCAFAGGGDAGVILDLEAPGIDTLDPADLRVLGKLLKAAQPARKELIQNNPFPKEYAEAMEASVGEDCVYRPGYFRLHADIDHIDTSVRIFCWMRATHPLSWSHDVDAGDIGGGEGLDDETSKARSILEERVLKLSKAIRALPGFQRSFLQVTHWLDYPKI